MTITAEHINNDTQQIVNETLSIINKNNVESIYLFGSMARGNDTQKSDYDIAIIVKKYPKNDLKLIATIKSSLFNKIKRPLDIILLEPNDLEQSPLFQRELSNNHKKLFGKDILKKYESIIQKIKTSKPIVKSEPMWYYA